MELDLVFEKLIKNEVSYKSENLGLNLLISRVQKKYLSKPTSQELESCLEELRVFFDKYQRIMVNDIETLRKL